MACCLAPQRYMNQCWLIIHEVSWYSLPGQFQKECFKDSLFRDWKMQYSCVYRMHHRPVLVLVLINQYLYSYSCQNQVLVLILTHITCTCKSVSVPIPRPVSSGQTNVLAPGESISSQPSTHHGLVKDTARSFYKIVYMHLPLIKSPVNFTVYLQMGWKCIYRL